MFQTITITSEDILHNVKLQCRISENIAQIVTRKVVENAAAEIEIKVEIEELQHTNFRLHILLLFLAF